MKTYNITIDQNTDFFLEVTLSTDEDEVIDLSEYSNPRGALKPNFQSNTQVNFDCNIVGNTITIELSSNTTSTLESGDAVYDVLITDSVDRTVKLLSGNAKIRPTATGV